jgi:hypothetical protein
MGSKIGINILLYFGFSPELAGLRLFRPICVLMTVLGRRAQELRLPYRISHSMNHDASMARTLIDDAKLI